MVGNTMRQCGTLPTVLVLSWFVLETPSSLVIMYVYVYTVIQKHANIYIHS